MGVSEDSDKIDSIIWTFSTRGGQLRLHVANAERTTLPELHANLRGCALVADDVTEFLELSVRAVTDAGAVLADVLPAPATHKPLKDAIRSTAQISDPLKAAHILVNLLVLATDQEREEFSTDSSFEHERRYVFSLLHALDEHREAVLEDLGRALRIPAESVLTLGN